MTDDTTTETESKTEVLTRRTLLGGVVAAGLGASGYFVGSAEAAPTGTFPRDTDDPLLKIRADRIRLVGRSSDPSSPSDGTVWYRGDL
jgi:hypothetical protein